MFLPTTYEEIKSLGWQRPDVVIVSGDAYVDSPYDGAAVIGKVLTDAGYKAGIISQPALNDPADISRLGEPRLFWGVTAGAVDSMVANYTSLLKKKKSDDATPGGRNTRRPDRAVIRYSNLIRQYFKNTVPIILGGIEASLRRIAHYDYWTDSIRRSVLFDAKADAIVYGMAEKTICELAGRLKKHKEWRDLRGLCYISGRPVESFLEIPSYEDCLADKESFEKMFMLFYENNDPLNAKGLVQKHGNRFLVQNPPNEYLSSKELDHVHELDYEYEAHPFYRKQGKIKATETVKFSVNTHRGCFGECNFCAIAVHQGRRIRSRTEASVIREIRRYTEMKSFHGNIYDLGGPTANMYGMDCPVMSEKGACKKKRCLSPEKCEQLRNDHSAITKLYRAARSIPGVRKVFIGSGVRYDLAVADDLHGQKYIRELAEHHVSGQLKIAPEHTSPKVLRAMGKPDDNSLLIFKEQFDKASKNAGKRQYLTYYLIAAHPGCEMNDMHKLRHFLAEKLKMIPEQVQIFTPTPSTISALMYYTGRDPYSGKTIFSEHELRNKRKQKEAITAPVNPYSKRKPRR